MVDDVMNLVGQELVQDRDCYSAIGQCGQKRHSPLTGISSTHGYLVTTLYPTVLEQNMQFLYLSSHIVELQSSSLIVSQSIEIPIVDDALLYELIETWVVFHNTLFI